MATLLEAGSLQRRTHVGEFIPGNRWAKWRLNRLRLRNCVALVRI